MTDYSELKRLAEAVEMMGSMDIADESAWMLPETGGKVLALIAENDEYRAVAEHPASLNASPAAEYEGLKRQFFALRNYALCKDKLSGYYSRELEKLRGVDRSQSAEEIDAERDINAQLTNDLLAVEAERDQLKAENEALKRDKSEPCDGCFMADAEALRKDAERFRYLMFNHVDWARNGKDDDAVALTYGPYPSHGLRKSIDAAMSKEG